MNEKGAEQTSKSATKIGLKKETTTTCCLTMMMMMMIAMMIINVKINSKN